MIARVWHGWTKSENADAYQNLLTGEVLPGIHRVPGYRGAWLLRKTDGDETAFITITLFDSMDAVRGFAGSDHEKAVILPAAHDLLSRFDERSEHYEVIASPS
jgi:heme-degrading monooxygenase HmoA